MDYEMIRRFSYFRGTIEEVQVPEAHPRQPGLTKQSILSGEYYEGNWLASKSNLEPLSETI